MAEIARPDPIEHAGSPGGDGLDVAGAKARREAGVAGLDARSGPLDDDRFRNAGEPQFHRAFDGRAAADSNVLLVIRRKFRAFHVE